LCGRKIAPGEPWHIEHMKARGLGGKDSDDNLRPAHIDCHAGKTKKERAIMADADAALLKHCGLDRENKRTRWPKRTINQHRGSP
jgi:5-methylcytosine-specific restriction enzyme A